MQGSALWDSWSRCTFWRKTNGYQNFALHGLSTKYLGTVYPEKYAHGFCFAVLCCGYTLTDLPISIRLTSLALWQSNDCPSASKATLMNMDKYLMWIHYERLHTHNKAKHNKTVCILLGIYCIICTLITGQVTSWCSEKLHTIDVTACAFQSEMALLTSRGINNVSCEKKLQRWCCRFYRVSVFIPWKTQVIWQKQ